MKKNCQRMKHQSGIVLVVSLVFLIALMGIASMLMLNTVIDMKMAGANQDKVIALEAAMGELESVMLSDISIAEVSNPVDVSDCPASKNGYSTNIVKCRVVKTSITKKYGKNSSNEIEVHASVSKQVLSLGQ